MDTVLVTGVNGEVGHATIPILAKEGLKIIALDITDLDIILKGFVTEFYKGSVLDKILLSKIFAKYKIDTIYHFGALLSTAAEKDPELAQSVNAGGTATIIALTNQICIKDGRPIKFIFPSTIAAYGLPNLKTKMEAAAITEDEYQNPITMYGINKLYCENLGTYYSKNYKMLEPDIKRLLDFRCVRFPGLISAITIPTGGTSDYGAEMIHTAAQGENYESFVREDTTLPFMVMPDAVKALITLANADKSKLTRSTYNVNSFSISAKEIADMVLKVFPNTAIDYNPHPIRQRIVDSWPAAVDDSLARRDWHWQPDYDIKRAFEEYLIPEIQNRYRK